MSIQEPAWRKRTRPCPFFSQGRCLFADSCNFLHDIKVRSAVHQPLLGTTQVKQHSKPVFDPPSVVVDSASPRSVNQPSSHNSPGSIKDSSRYSGLLSVLSDVIGPPPNTPIVSEDAIQRTRTASVSSNGDQSSVLPSNASDVTLVDPFMGRMDVALPEVVGQLFAEFQPVPDGGELPDGDTASYLVEDTTANVEAGLEADKEYVDDDSTVVMPDRQSTFSSFTGASLLASPRNNFFEDSSVTNPVEDGVTDLLSPVHLSAKLRPISISSSVSRLKRGDSIDSGYADGVSWVGPRPFPRSPPRSFRSSMTFPHHSRGTSSLSFVLEARRVSYDVNALRPSSHRPIEVINEVESNGSSEENADAASAILAVYDTSLSEEPGESDAFNVKVTETAEEDNGPLEVPAVMRPGRHVPDHLYPTRELDLECHQPSFFSDDNMSFKTALSTQPSCDSLSDVSKVSPAKQDSHLSPPSACSTPNTSILSQYDDASEQPIVDSFPCELPCFVATSSAPTTHPQTAPAVSDVIAGADDPQGPALGTILSTQESQSGDFQIDRHLLTSAVPDPFDADGMPQECLSAAFHPDSHPPKPSLSTEISYLSSYPDVPEYDGLDASEVPDFASQSYSSDVLFPDVEPSPSTEGSCGPILAKNILGHPFRDVDGKEDGLLVNAIPPRKHITHFEQYPPQSNLSDPGLSEPSFTAISGHPSKHDTVEDDNDQSLVVENSLGSDGVASTFEMGCDSSTQRLSFPLPPPFLPDEFVEHSTIGGERNESIPSDTDVLDLEERTLTVSQPEEVQRIRSGSDLTEKGGPSRLPIEASSDSDIGTNFILRRSRAASDITVKGKSDTTVTPGHLRSPPLASEQLGPSDSVQSLYDQYFDSGASERGLELSSPHSKDVALLDVPSRKEEYSQDIHSQAPNLIPHLAQEESYLCSDGKLSTSGTDSSRSETGLRPLLTGRTSFLRSSVAELAPNANLVNATISSIMHPTTRLQTREIGSTMVPLGFRRHRPQPRPPQSSRIPPQPLSNVLPVSQLREVLRIRTDIRREELPPGCSSAIQASGTTLSPLPAQSMSAPPSTGLKQLRLSTIINKRSSILSAHSPSIASSISSSNHISNSPAPQSPSVSSVTSFSHNSQLSSSCEQIPEQIHHTFRRSISSSPIPQATDDVFFTSRLLGRRDSRSASAPIQQPKPWRLSHYRAGSRNYIPADSTRRLSRRASVLNLSYSVSEQPETDEDDSTTSHSQQASDWTHATSVHPVSVHAIATPKPTLLFAIASDDVNQVRQVLENGEAGPNDSVGPQSALAFTLTNDKLAHKQEIVKALLAYGANPSALRNPALNPPPRIEGDEQGIPPPETTLEGMDPATRYFVARADAPHTRRTSQLIYRSFFRPLTRVQYDVIGQDWALEQLFRVLGMHSQKLAVAPIVVLLCGPSGHGKSLLARKFGSLLDVPIHTVNMTTLQSAHDIWQSYSMNPYEEPSSCTLAEFLIENEEKRCIVVLDEIEKVEDQKALWSLLMPWELGRCSLEAGKRHVDARNVIWLGTSNIGHELVFEYHEKRSEQEARMTREEYLELTDLLRPRVSHCLGASLVSRVTTVLPFVPFTLNEKKAIAAEAVYALAGDAAKMLSPQEVESLVVRALPSYQPSEGARSLHRAISNILVDAI